ncbi:uncharacterized protein METZ01_LOCUS444352, partial [marine metagenome]
PTCGKWDIATMNSRRCGKRECF